MQTSEKAEDFVEKLTNALYKRELKMEKEASERLENDYRSGKIPKEVYQKIMHEGIPCAECGFPVTPTAYGESVETHHSEKALKIICRHCLEPVEW